MNSFWPPLVFVSNLILTQIFTKCDLKLNLNLKEQQPRSFLLPAHLLSFLHPYFYASHTVNQPGSKRLVTMHQLFHKEGGSRLLSSCGPAGLAAALCSGLPRQRPDPRTTVRLPGENSSNDRPLPLKQSQEHTGTERHTKTRVLMGTRKGNKKHNSCIC